MEFEGNVVKSDHLNKKKDKKMTFLRRYKKLKDDTKTALREIISSDAYMIYQGKRKQEVRDVNEVVLMQDGSFSKKGCWIRDANQIEKEEIEETFLEKSIRPP